MYRLQTEFPRAAREIIITFDNAPLLYTSANVTNKAFDMVNNPLAASQLN
jgi:hypothetical protein